MASPVSKMGREEREAYDELKQNLSDFCGIQAVDNEDDDKQVWWPKQTNYWNEKYERLDRELDEVMEAISEPPPPDR
ncbi:hypothetical protein CNMCM5623_005895 [Aspergillus felis]|uniref:Uncharacterized protein n=1 Tax=Aspergillus felis TaxID=1287682 RepID=A0A8H6QYH4_9EURO|nr:hypothetical protein CNMCM5623_005895 [Aspergillus felis]KAF7181343.1 hypothetical protein CNMCM7691_000561 [Aspergillus felis]